MENTVLINSIGTANPGVSKILADAFKMPQEFILNVLYNAPSVLFQKVDLDLAQKAETILTKLGLDVQILDKSETPNLTKEQVEASIYFEDILALPKVLQQLSEFLGCKPAEALNLLIAQPSVVLGGISEATAKALQDRVDAAVCFSNPRNDLFTLYIPSDLSKNELSKLTAKLQQPLQKLPNGDSVIKDLSYGESTTVWRACQSKTAVRIINQSHQLVQLHLTAFDIKNEQHVSYLTETIGMPLEILPELAAHLPITLHEHISTQTAQKIAKACQDIGIESTIEQSYKTTRKLSIEAIKDHDGVQKVLAQFLEIDSLNKASCWESTTEIPDLIARYLYAQLELLDCQPTIH